RNRQLSFGKGRALLSLPPAFCGIFTTGGRNGERQAPPVPDEGDPRGLDTRWERSKRQIMSFHERSLASRGPAASPALFQAIMSHSLVGNLKAATE
ncbi:MAG TPA: hypothetical protein VK143_05280, partial [Burkholderiales bacterium]|nr:hypothetical protein [Burkholderiales bacterium]